MGTAAGVNKTSFIFTTMGSCGPKASGGKEVVPSLVSSGTGFLRGWHTHGGVDFAGLLGLTVGAGVVAADAPAVRGTECAGDPLVLDGGTKLGDGTCVGGGSRDRGGALWRTWTGGLDGKKELLDLEEPVDGELGEFGIG